MGRGISKGRTSETYSHKLNAIKKRHAKREADRKIHQALVEKLKLKKDLSQKEQRIVNKKYKELKPLSWYVDKLKPAGGRESSVTKTTTAKPKRQIGGYW